MGLIFMVIAYWLCVIGFAVTGSILVLYLYDQWSKGKRRDARGELVANVLCGLMLSTVFLYLSVAIRGF